MKVFANCDDSLQKDKGLGCSLMKALDVPLYGRALKPRKVLLQNQHGACWWALYLSTPSLEWLMPRYRQWTNGINIIFMFSPTNSLKSSAFSGNYISPLCYVSIDLLLLHGGYHLLGFLNSKGVVMHQKNEGCSLKYSIVCRHQNVHWEAKMGGRKKYSFQYV